ncbi:hypothetical protein ONE63_002195 [Megalurothrips usitatus]|uniref:Uncharacterized protein n=1 Tax=Megalurothrips usitatus TaxID=439358 RepID=A0AAV7XH15_9NEOP|nr:hypothetical protein ONE63_002195 [Megalurothrips usitatus]
MKVLILVCLVAGALAMPGPAPTGWWGSGLGGGLGSGVALGSVSPVGLAPAAVGVSPLGSVGHLGTVGAVGNLGTLGGLGGLGGHGGLGQGAWGPHGW